MKEDRLPKRTRGVRLILARRAPGGPFLPIRFDILNPQRQRILDSSVADRDLRNKPAAKEPSRSDNMRPRQVKVRTHGHSAAGSGVRFYSITAHSGAVSGAGAVRPERSISGPTVSMNARKISFLPSSVVISVARSGFPWSASVVDAAVRTSAFSCRQELLEFRQLDATNDSEDNSGNNEKTVPEKRYRSTLKRQSPSKRENDGSPKAESPPAIATTQ